MKTYEIKRFPCIGNNTDDILLQLLLSDFRSRGCHYESHWVEIGLYSDNRQRIIGQQGVEMSTLDWIILCAKNIFGYVMLSTGPETGIGTEELQAVL